MDLLHPQLNYDGVSENYAQLELQIVPYLSALVFQLTGTMTPVVPRLLCMLFFLGSAWFLYRLMRGISGPVACTGWAGDLPFFAPVDDDRPRDPAGGLRPDFFTVAGCGCSGVSSRPGGWPSCGGPQP